MSRRLTRSIPGKGNSKPLSKAAAWKNSACAFCLNPATHIATHECGDPTCWHPQAAVCRWCLHLLGLFIGDGHLTAASRIPPLKVQQKKSIKTVEKLIRANRSIKPA